VAWPQDHAKLDRFRALMADGRNNAQIAASLFVSENTVKTHVRRIFDKLGSRDRAAAVLQAWKRHVI